MELLPDLLEDLEVAVAVVFAVAFAVVFFAGLAAGLVPVPHPTMRVNGRIAVPKASKYFFMSSTSPSTFDSKVPAYHTIEPSRRAQTKYPERQVYIGESTSGSPFADYYRIRVFLCFFIPYEGVPRR